MNRTKIERILCPVDFSGISTRAYDYATSLAEHCGAKLFVMHVVELSQYPSASFAATWADYDRFCRTLLSEGKEQLQVFLKSHAKNGIDPESVTCEGIAADCILSFSEQQSINLIVMGTHGIRGFERLMLGSVTEKVLRMARCPVLAVSAPSHDGNPSATPQNGIELRQIIFCTDFSDISNGALDYAISVADEYHANLTLVHVIDGVSKSEDITQANERLDQLIPLQVKLNSRITTMVRIGRAYREINQVASEIGADLVIMAVHGRHAPDDAVFGSTTYRVLQLGSCPVLAVHLKDRSGP